MTEPSRATSFLRNRGPALALDVGINILLPYAVYSYAQPHVGEVKALMISSAPPILWSLVEFARHRRVDALSILVLAGIVLSLLGYIGGGGAKMLQLREKLVTGIIGLAFLLSAAVRRPLIYELARASMIRQGSAEADRMHALRDNPAFRRTMTLMTVVWGFGLVIDVAVGCVLVFALSIKQYMLVGPVVGYSLMAALGLWTFWFARRARARGEAARTARQV